MTIIADRVAVGVRVGRQRTERSGPSERDHDPDGAVKSVTAALDVLDCFSHEPELGVSDIARRLGVAKSTAHRLLTSLRSRDLVERNPQTGQYRLGLHLFELGQLTQERMRLRRIALPLLEELRAVGAGTAQLSVPQGADVLHVERLEPVHGRGRCAPVPRRMPVHATSSGKALAAWNDELAQRRRQAGFPILTDATIRTAEEFDRELATVRRCGVATNLGESRPGVCSVAAAVLDAGGVAVAALALVRPTGPDGGELGRQARLVSVAAARITRGLGC